MFVQKKILKAVLIGATIALSSGSAGAVDWIMASGYPDSNFMTKNIRAFIKDVEATTSVKINLNANDTLMKLDAIKSGLQRGQIPIGEIRLGVYGNEDPMYILAGLPFIAADYSKAWLLKDLGKGYIDKAFKKKGLKILYYRLQPVYPSDQGLPKQHQNTV